MIEAVILDGHTKSALAAVRSLGRRNVFVACGDSRSTAMALHSRHCHYRFTYPDPLEHAEEFIQALLHLPMEDGHKPLLYTFSDTTSFLISQNRERLRHKFTVSLPDQENFLKTFDKSKTLALAKSLNIAVPKTLIPRTFDEVESMVKEFSGWPVVVKPKMNCVWHGNRGVRARVRFAFSRAEVVSLSHQIESITGMLPLLQEYIPGQELGVEGLYHNGQPIFLCAHERLRSIDPVGGAAVYKKSIPIDQSMKDISQNILASLAWQGPVMVEFRKASDGKLYLLEINGRWWGSLPLAVFAGADLPYWQYVLMQKGSLADLEKERYRIGIRSRYLLGDISWLVKMIFPNHATRQLVSISKGKAIQEFFAGFDAGVYEDVWDSNDWQPFFWDMIDALNH